MSCNGCRVLRKGCSETCALRPCLQWIESPEAQGHATVFVAKFFGRAGLMEFISAVPENERPELFQSLLYEACGRTVNPVYGAVGLLWTGNWQACQDAVDTVLKGGTLLRPASASMPSGPNRGSNPLMHCLRNKPFSSIQREKLQAVPQSNLSNISESVPSFGNCIQPLRPKRPADHELHQREVERDTAYHFQARSESKKHRSSDDASSSRSDCVVRLVQGNSTRQGGSLSLSNPPLFHADMVRSESNDRRRWESARDPSASQILAPVPVRARPRTVDTEISGFLRARGDLASHEDLLTEVHENLELDLALTSNHQSAYSGRSKKGCTRVSSPSTISFNSEGSVTNFESSDFSMSPCLLRSPSPKEPEHKLLDLLL